MTYSILAARLAVGASAVAVGALAALHPLKPDLDPSSTMISQYARGPFGWVMTLCFAAFALGSFGLFGALLEQTLALSGHVGMGFLLAAGVGLAMAAVFTMDPVSTPPAQMSFSGKMHGMSFLIAVPCMALSTLLLSLTARAQTFPAPSPVLLLALTLVIWLGLAVVIAIMLMVGPGKPPDPTGPERFLGWPCRVAIAVYGVWLMVVAWPIAR